MPDLISCKQQQQKNTEEVDYLKKVLTCLFPFFCTENSVEAIATFVLFTKYIPNAYPISGA